jgi:hypothetical protein
MTHIELPNEKKVKHLTLLRQPRTISGKEFNALSAEERLMMIRSADSGQRYRLLIEAIDGPELMSRLPEQDLFLMFKEIGEDEVADLMPMITPNQYTACLDLDCWESDCFKSNTALSWLERLLECEPGTVLTTIREMDFELLILLLKKHIQIIQGMETIHDADNQVTAMDRIGGYEVNFPGERESKLFTDLFNILFQYDAPFYIHLMEASRGELDSVIEESVYLQRSDRMLDLGLPDPDSARSIYAWLDPETFSPDEVKLTMTKLDDSVAPPAFMLAVAQPKNLLAAALAAGLSDSGCWELAYLSNKVLITNQVDVGDRDDMRDSLEGMFDRLNLALEHLCGDDVEKAAELLDQAYFEHLFRVGYSLTLKLQRRARILQAAATGPYLDAPDKDFLQALLRRPHPLLFEGIEHPGLDDKRNFQTLRDLRLAADHLDHLDLLRELFEERLPFSLPKRETDLTGCIPASTSDLDLSTLFLTALGNKILDREFTPVPIPAEDLPILHGRISKERTLDLRLRDETVVWMESLIEKGGTFAQSTLDIWKNDFCPIDPAAIDPRYLQGMIIRI